jgi:hypothetical protein
MVLAVMLGAVALYLSLGAADLPGRWRYWRYSRPVVADSSEATGPAEIVLPWDILAHCSPDCADLRLIKSSSGQEVAYELRTAGKGSTSQSFAARLKENSFVAGQFTQVVGDLGTDIPVYTLLRVETAEADFIVWAEVALSDDAKTWRVVEPRAPIARFSKRSINGTQTISFQGLDSRYLRLRIFQADHQFPVTGLTVFHQEESRPVERTPVPTTFSQAKARDENDSAWSADLAASHIPVSRLRFTTDTDEFYRAVRISGSTDGKEWLERGSGCIYRYKLGTNVRESLAIDFWEWSAGENLRVEVLNGNDAPLRDVSISLYAIPRRLLFKAQSGVGYSLLYGNERAAAPQYDLSRYLEAGPTKPSYADLRLGPEELTANYRDPRPFTERHPELLWLSLGIAIVLIGVTALKTLRSPAEKPPDPS